MSLMGAFPLVRVGAFLLVRVGAFLLVRVERSPLVPLAFRCRSRNHQVCHVLCWNLLRFVSFCWSGFPLLICKICSALLSIQMGPLSVISGPTDIHNTPDIQDQRGEFFVAKSISTYRRLDETQEEADQNQHNGSAISDFYTLKYGYIAITVFFLVVHVSCSLLFEPFISYKILIFYQKQSSTLVWSAFEWNRMGRVRAKGCETYFRGCNRSDRREFPPSCNSGGCSNAPP